MPIEIVDFRKYTKQTLRGFLTVRLTNIALEIRECTLHEKNGKRWVGLPAKPYQDEDGTQKWSYIIKFYEKVLYNRFQSEVLKALDGYLNGARNE